MDYSKTEINWSFSRMKMLSECQRKYFYNYYLYNGGWLADADERKRQAYRLKKLQNIYMLFGTAVHSTIKELLAGKFTPDESIILQRRIGSEIKAYYNESVNGKNYFIKHPNQSKMLSEVYYDNDIPDILKQKTNENVMKFSKAIFENLYSVSKISEGHQIIELDELKSFEFENQFTCFLKIDLLTKDESGKYYVYDWKTGKYNDEHPIQLLAYAFFVSRQYGISPEQIECKLCYWETDDVISFTFTNSDFAMFEERLALDFHQMQGYLQNISENTPRSEEWFERSGHNCKTCNFREMCQ